MFDRSRAAFEASLWYIVDHKGERILRLQKGKLVAILQRNGNALRVVDTRHIRTVIAPRRLSPDMKGPKHLCVDRDDSVIIADGENHVIRRYAPKSGTAKTIAGTGTKGTHIDATDPLKTEFN